MTNSIFHGMMRLAPAVAIIFAAPMASALETKNGDMVSEHSILTRSPSQQQQHGGARSFEVLDVQQVSTGNTSNAVKTFVLSGKPKIVDCDVIIAGGGMGGVAAAIRAAQMGAHVCVTEETDWIGGQATAQGVSALDENYMVEVSGASRLYQKLRENIRNYYRNVPGAKNEVAGDARLNPGDCWVSWLSFEPQVALDKLTDLIKEETGKNPPAIFLREKVVAVKVVRGRVHSLTSVNLDTGKFTEFRAKFCIDATELGDLLPLAKVPYSSGAEPRSQTDEPHAPENANVENVQDFVFPFVIEYRDDGNHVIDKPAHYDDFLREGKFTLIGYKIFQGAKIPGSDAEYLPFWTYRRLISRDYFPNSLYKYDVSMINWEANDLRGENIIDKSPSIQAERLALAKDLSLGFLYWLQTEAPRDEGGKGYPEFCLRTDVLATTDGLSKYPYIRESRRILANKIVTEQEIAAATNSGARAKLFSDSVGIGLYPIDIHGYQDIPGAGQPSKPFQIPLGAMVQTTVRNLIPACKNIGTTHVTNGAYRLHPIEWAIGEAAGTLAGFCLHNRTVPFKVAANQLKLRRLQNLILRNGSPVFWYDDVPTSHENFAAIQYVSIAGLMQADDSDLHFRPEDLITVDEINAISDKLFTHMEKKNFLKKILGTEKLDSPPAPQDMPTRAEFAQTLYQNAGAK